MFRSIETASGRISYAETGAGPVALFVHGVLLNKHLGRNHVAGLSDIRRCIAIDLLAKRMTSVLTLATPAYILHASDRLVSKQYTRPTRTLKPHDTLSN